MHAGRRLFRDALDRGLDPGEPAGTCRETLLDLGEKAFLFFILRVGDERGILLCLGAQENEQSGIAAIIKDHIAGLDRPVEDAAGIFPIFLKALAFEGEDRDAALGDRGCGMILGRVDVAGSPAHLGTERHQGFDEDCGLDRHMERARNARALQWLLAAQFFADRHQARHFHFGHLDLLAAPVGQTDIGNMKIL